jgi:hypothetical protein
VIACKGEDKDLGVIYARIDDTLEKEFRVKTAKRFGGERGALSRAIEEAIKLWLKENEGS